MKLDFDPGFDITPLSVDEGFRLGADCFDKGTELSLIHISEPTRPY